MRCVTAGDSKNAPARGARGGNASPGRAERYSSVSPARDVRPGISRPRRSLRPSRVTASSGLRQIQGTDSVLRFKTHSLSGIVATCASCVLTHGEVHSCVVQASTRGRGPATHARVQGRGRDAGTRDSGRCARRRGPAAVKRSAPGRMRWRGADAKRPAPGWEPAAVRLGQAVASARSSARLRVLLGSTGMPGPIVVVKVTFFRYRPLAAAGLSLITSSRAAA